MSADKTCGKCQHWQELGQVSPTLPAHDARDRALPDPELRREFTVEPLACGVQRSDLDNVRLSQFGLGKPCSARHPLRMDMREVIIPGRKAPLGDTVMHVLFLRSGEQVAGVLTKGIVTFVTDTHRAWINPVLQEVGDAMGEEHSPSTKSSVSTASDTSRPQPAVVRSKPEHFFPESGNVARGQRGDRNKLSLSHVASSKGHKVRAVAVLVTLRGLLNYVR